MRLDWLADVHTPTPTPTPAHQEPEPRNCSSGFQGKLIPGGCEHCDALQEVRPEASGDDIWHLTVYHEPNCPFWLRRTARLASGA